MGRARVRPNAPKNIILLMIRVANAPCSWGVLEFDGASAPAPFTQVLDEMRAAGYDGTELGDWGFMPSEPSRLRGELAARGLAMVGAFVPVGLADRATHERGIDAAVRTAALMRDAGAERAFIVLSDDNARVAERERHAGRITRAQSLPDADWATFAAGATRIAAAVRDATGVQTVFHPHAGGYVEAPWEIDELMTRTDPAVLGLLLDTGHILYGGGDPVDVLRRHAARVWHVHFKDCDLGIARRARQQELGYLDAVRAQVFCELGKGDVDFPSVLDALTQLRYDGWIVVEQDVFPGRGTPFESASRNRAFIRSLGL
jgi:inosose dehydratase